MSHAIDFPVFLKFITIIIVPGVHCIGVTTWNLSRPDVGRTIKINLVCLVRGQEICFHPLLHDLVPVDGIDYEVTSAVKNNGRNDTCKASHRSIGRLSLQYRIWTAPA